MCTEHFKDSSPIQEKYNKLKNGGTTLLKGHCSVCIMAGYSMSWWTQPPTHINSPAIFFFYYYIKTPMTGVSLHCSLCFLLPGPTYRLKSKIVQYLGHLNKLPFTQSEWGSEGAIVSGHWYAERCSNTIRTLRGPDQDWLIFIQWSVGTLSSHSSMETDTFAPKNIPYLHLHRTAIYQITRTKVLME